MGQELTNTATLRELYRLAIHSPGQLLASNTDTALVEATIEWAKTLLVPAKELPSPQHSAAMEKIIDAMRPLGVKVLPTASPEQCQVWLVAVADGLSDLPADIVVRAATDARHGVYKFVSDVEGAVRDKAVELLEQRKRAIRTLERRKNQRSKLEQPAIDQTPKPWTVERVRSTPVQIIKMGLAGGFIQQSVVDEAFPDGLSIGEGQNSALRCGGGL